MNSRGRRLFSRRNTAPVLLCSGAVIRKRCEAGRSQVETIDSQQPNCMFDVRHAVWVPDPCITLTD